MTTDGRFVSRYEAQNIAAATGQRRRPASGPNRFEARFGLTAQDVTQAAKAPASKIRVAASEPGSLGSAGLWGRSYSPPSTGPGPQIPAVATGATSSMPTGAVPAFYRSTRQGSLDAKGLSPEELQSSLLGAWDAGFDSAKVLNYTAPGSKAPETVTVVRNKNQLRLPTARFDPAKKDSANLLAGLLPLTTFGALMSLPPEERP
ncbi:hypothetical protein [Reyranella sp. CPCC 100927]|uniref:hypothetical protein n=1 Tax=Reyranella sp. CPCC 100927 TaxID=2599616 RepID=UPI0011B45273|nr:hypothetical protein [Reyranella sp. CPCC 100927]TWT11708.1 hypothetical protein FQU96_14635 [Reyranella sp. CPCC 100927]